MSSGLCKIAVVVSSLTHVAILVVPWRVILVFFFSLVVVAVAADGHRDDCKLHVEACAVSLLLSSAHASISLRAIRECHKMYKCMNVYIYIYRAIHYTYTRKCKQQRFLFSIYVRMQHMCT